MASADVLYLDQILEQISNPHLEQHQTPLQDQKIKSLQETLNFLLDFLDDSRQRRSEELRCLEREIRDAACKAADIIELHILKNFGQEEFHERHIRDQTFCENFEIVADEIDSFKTKADKLKELWGPTDLHHSQRTSLPTGQSRLPSIGKNDMVGFRKDLMEIMDRLTGYPPALQFIQVTGMGGIGKTTLARNVYNDPRIALCFDTHAWVSISQEYREREVLLSLLDSTKRLNAEMLQEKSTDEEKLKEYLYKSLKGRRYLVVMDDVWTTEAWDSLRMIFPDDRNGSRIMLATRLTSSLVHESSHSYLHRMQFLNKIDSWNLLCRNVFGEDSCPSELEEAGKKIAENCKGLPLSLVVIGGHLSNANRTKDHWEYVAQNVKPTDANCLEILSLSYDYLPHYLKACFLYMGVFPEDDEIRVSKLIKLWVAEGFLKPVRGKTLEEVAEEYLGDLISRNLIMISKKSSRGKIKTCGIHDRLRDLCLKKAQEEKFFHVRDTDNIFAESKYSRRLCIHPDILHEEFKCYQSMGSVPLVRSILISSFPRISYSEGRKGLDESQINELVDGKLFPLLRVLDFKRHAYGFPFEEIKLVHLRYLAFSSYEKVSMSKILPDIYRHLQTLIVDGHNIHLPEEIWKMTQLRHLLSARCYLPYPTRSPIAGENFVLGNLLTLSKVSASSCTKEVFERVPNLNKLGIFYDAYNNLFLGTLVNLPQLETLKITSNRGRVQIPINFTFPPSIKKLTLKGCKIAWKHMTIVGSMPNLEVLKLLENDFRREPDWEPTEGEFCKLKFLLLTSCFLVQWRANNSFTSLECLMLRECSNLEEIPCSFGDIPTLQIIDLDDASPSVVFSAKKIQEEQENFGNNSLQVRVKRQFYHPRTNKLKNEAIANLESNDNLLQIRACSELNHFIVVSRGIDPPSEGFIYGMFPRLLEFLGRVDYPMLQLAAARVIAKISLNSSDNILIELGAAVSTMVSLLSFPTDEHRREALVVLGMIANVSAESRDLVLSHGVLMPLLEQFNDKTKPTIMEQATFTLSVLCMRKPRFEQIKSAILPLAHLIHKNGVKDLWYACEALFHLTCGEMDMKQAVIDAGVFPRLFDFLLRFSYISTLSLCIVGNIISYVDDTQIQVIIDNGSLPRLCKFLTRNHEVCDEKATCHIISNIIGRTKDHIQAVIEAGIISPLLPMLQDAHLFNAAAEAIYNVTTKGTNEQIMFVVHEGCIEPMCDLLVNPNEVHVIKICLEGLENILKVGEAEKNQGNTEDVNVFAQMIVDAGGLQKIKNLQTHDNSKIREQVGKILKTYWWEEDDE